MTPIDFFSVSDPLISVYNRGTNTLVVANLVCSARITGSLIARQINLTGIPNGDYDLIAELPTPGSFVLRIVNLIPTIALSWQEFSNSLSALSTITFTVKDPSNVPISGSTVYITTDIAGNTVYATGLVSNSLGVITTQLPSGTFYVFASHPLKTFNNPTTINTTRSYAFNIVSDGSVGTYRTTVALVRVLGGFPSSLDLEPYLSSANVLVDDIAALNDTCMNAKKLELVERWLSAHFAKINSPSVTSKSIAGASASFEGKSTGGEGLMLTSYGQQAMALDCTGFLRNLNKPKGSMTWLGTIAP